MPEFTAQLSGMAGAGVDSGPAPVDQTGAILAKGLETAADLFKENKEAELQMKTEQFRNTRIAQFSQQQLKIADMVNRGVVSADKARLKMRENVQKAIAASPELADDLLKTHSSLVATAGLAKSAASQAAEIDARINKTIESGWGSDKMSREELLGATYAREQFEFQREQMKAYQAEVSLQNSLLEQQGKKISNQRAEIALGESIEQRQANQQVKMLAKSFYPKTQAQVNTILRSMPENPTPQQMEEAVLGLTAIEQELDSVVVSLTAGADREKVTSMVGPIKQMIADAKMRAKGELSGEVMQNRMQNHMSTLQLSALMSDEDFSKEVAISKLFPNTPPSLIRRLQISTARVIPKMSAENPQRLPNILDPENSTYIEGFLLEHMRRNNLAPDEKTELSNAINNTLKSAAKYSAVEDRVDAYKPVLNLAASPEFLKQMQEGTVSRDDAQKVAGVYLELYQNKILPDIQEKFSQGQFSFVLPPGGKAPEDAKVRTERGYLTYKQVADVPTLAAITPEFKRGTVSFVVNPELPESSQLAAQQKAAELNKTVAPAINKFVRAGAHLGGSGDYQAYFDEAFDSLFNPNPGSITQ